MTTEFNEEVVVLVVNLKFKYQQQWGWGSREPINEKLHRLISPRYSSGVQDTMTLHAADILLMLWLDSPGLVTRKKKSC